MNSPQEVEPIVVLGGGIAGLAASLASGAPVYEAQHHVGGVAASDSQDGFTFDRGIHVLQTANTKVMKLLDDVGVRLNSRSRQAYIYSHDTYTAYPFQVNTAGLPMSLRMRCVWTFLRRPKEAQPRNYEEWMHAKLGRGFADTFLIPYSEKFWTVHPRDMTHEWTGNRVPQPSMSQVIRGALWSRQTKIGTNVDFRYPSSAPGYGAIGDAMSRKVERLHLGHRAAELDMVQRRVKFQNGHSVAYQRLITTIPLPDLVSLCPTAPESVRKAAAALRANSICVVNLGIGRPGRTGWHWAHFPEKDLSFFRISFPHNLADNVTPIGMSSISAEVAYSSTKPINRSTIVEQVKSDLVRVGVLRADDPIVFTSTTDIQYAYCIHDFARKDAVRSIRAWMLSQGIVPTGRYGHWNYFWSHESIMSGLQAGEKALKELRGELVPGDTLDDDV
jgi:protoporphyrinogen oxidase